MTDHEYSTALARVQQQSAERRSVAWAPVPQRVLGLRLRPITPATFDLMHGTGNAFICGKAPVLADVENFILFHAPEFDPDCPAPRWFSRFRIAWRTAAALCPLFTMRRQSVWAQQFLRAVREIRAIVADTWADALPGNDGEDASPTLAASLHAQLADTFAREYHTWPLATPFRHTPLAQLFQLARCIDRYHLGREALYFDRAEAALTRNYLAAANPPR